MNLSSNDALEKPVTTVADLVATARTLSEKLEEAQDKIRGAEITAPTGHAPPSFPPTEEYGRFFRHAVIFCRLLSRTDFNRGNALGFATLMEKTKQYVVLDNPVELKHFSEMTETLQQVAKLAANINHALAALSAPASPTDAGQAAAEDLAFCDLYKELQQFRKDHGPTLRVSRVGADGLLLNCIDIALGIGHDYLRELDITASDVKECANTAKDLSDEIQHEGGNLNDYAYSFCTTARRFIHMVEGRAAREVSPSSSLKADCGIQGPPRPVAVQSAVASAIGPGRRLTHS